MRDEIAARLKKCGLFSGLSEKDVAVLASKTTKRRFREGELVFSEGDLADSIFVLVGGTVELVKYTRAGREVVMRSVSPVEAFAEAAAFSGGAFPATAVARADSEVLSVRRKDFVSFISSRPEAFMSMMSMMSELLIKLSSLIGGVLSGTVKGRLASYLLARVRSDGAEFRLGIKKSQLAKLVGTIPETLSRSLRALEKNGAIEMRGSTIAVKDASILEEMVESQN